MCTLNAEQNGSFSKKSSHIYTEVRAHGGEKRNTKNVEVDEKVKTLSKISSPQTLSCSVTCSIYLVNWAIDLTQRRIT